jgi:hypothetical protein
MMKKKKKQILFLIFHHLEKIHHSKITDILPFESRQTDIQ